MHKFNQPTLADASQKSNIPLPRLWVFVLFASLFISHNSFAQLSGTYTLCASGCDYSSFTQAADSLQANGVSGAVIFNVSAGNYNEQVTFYTVKGASSTNTITFKGAGRSSGGTRLYYSVANFGEDVVKLDGANYFAFENILFEQTNCGESRNTMHLSYASNVTFKNCMFKAPDNTSCSNMGFLWGMNAVHTDGSGDNVYENNIFYGGYSCYVGYYNGAGNDVFTKNKFVGGANETVQMVGGNNLVFTYNEIDSCYSFENRALNFGECNGIRVAHNKVGGDNVASGIAMYEINRGSNLTPSEIYNNFFDIRSSYSYAAIPISYWGGSGARVDLYIYHNTINIPNAVNGDGVAIEAEEVQGIRFMNNIITRGSGNVFTYRYAHEEDVISGNNFYCSSPGSNFILYNQVSYSSLADYKSAAAVNGHGMYDQSMSVTYKGKLDLHLDKSTPAPWGPTITKTDFDDDKRCESFSTAGADESNYSGNDQYKKPSTPSFTGPSTTYYKNPVLFENAASVGKAERYMWYINNVFVSDSIHLETADLTGPKDTVKLIAYNCGGKDSVEKIITVQKPTLAPVSDFISDVTNIRQGGTVKLMDISSNYPSEWEWDISPKTVYKNGNAYATYQVVYGKETSQNVHVKFLQGGKYTICFTAKNIVGSGSTECRTEYIEVMPAHNLGSADKSLNYEYGLIYDNGGPKGNYKPADQTRDYVVIGGCADSVYLVFKQFNLGCDVWESDYLRVFEGTNNKGRALHCTTNMSRGGAGPGFTGSPTSGCAQTCSPITGTRIDTFKAKGSMYIEMEARLWGAYYQGFEAYYWIKPKTQTAPVAKFSSIDSVCINTPISFKNESVGDDMEFMWDPDGDEVFEPIGKDAAYIFFVEGSHSVKFIAQNCGGADTFTKTVKVFLPKAPISSFYTENIMPTTADVVLLMADVAECVDEYKWTITHAGGTGKANFVNGTTDAMASPNVMFTDTGCYSVSLYVSNKNGNDELKLNCYIHVRAPYCTPTVKRLSEDVGISEVSFSNITNYSDQGISAYTNYVNDFDKAITVERGVSYDLSVKRNTSKNKVTRTAWIDWNYDGVFDASEKVGEEQNVQTKEWKTSVTIPTTIDVGATVMRVAINQGNNSNTVCGRNDFGEYEDYRIYIRPDLTKPVITLKGDTTIYLEQGHTYIDSGANASDNLDGNITGSIVTKEPKAGFNLIPGTYFYRYNVKDAAGNEADEVVRKVIITPDKTAPELIIAGADTVEVVVYSSTDFTPPAVVKAFDLVDGDLIDFVNINSLVNMNVVDTYAVTYTVKDMNENTTFVTRTVIVKDTTAPKMVVYGDDPFYVNVGTTYLDWGVTITDNYYPVSQLQALLQVSSNVNTNVTDTYIVTYMLTDPSGNMAQTVQRQVIVRDEDAPVLNMMGDTLVTWEVKTRYEDEDVYAYDSYEGSVPVAVSGTFYQQFPSGIPTALDTFTIVYTATDLAGNSSSQTRYVVVVDRTAPVIELTGNPTASVCRWATYTDAGYSLSDNFNANSDITISEEGDWTTSGAALEGPYSLRYKAVDKSGNTSYSGWRTIWVRNPYEFPCSTATAIKDVKDLEKAVKVYPNPNNGKFTVEANIPVNEQVRLTVTNMMGQEIAVISNGSLQGNKFTIDLSTHSAGIYLLNITTSTHTITKRIVVNK